MKPMKKLVFFVRYSYRMIFLCAFISKCLIEMNHFVVDRSFFLIQYVTFSHLFIFVLEMDDQLRRLETITNRLESFIGQLSSTGVNNQSNGNDNLANNVDNLPIIRDYDTLINESVKPFSAMSQKIGGDLTTMSDHVTRLFNAQQRFLRQAVQSKKPSDEQLMEAIKPQSTEIESITGIYRKYSIFH